MKLKSSTSMFVLTGMILLSSCSNEPDPIVAPLAQKPAQVQKKLNTSSFLKPNVNSAISKLKAKHKTSGSSIRTYTAEQKILPVDTDFKFEDKMWHLRKTNVYDAWKYSQGNKDLIVAVIDNGVDYTHPDLAGRVIKGPDFADKDADPMGMEKNGHGTHVAGIIAGNGNIKGIAPDVKIMALKVFSDKGGGTSQANMASAIRYAVKNKASIINMSIGPSTVLKVDNTRDFDSAINEAIASGVNIITAGGNSSYSSINKANVNEITVVATDEQDHLAGFTNYGNQELPKTISAPGQNIFSTVLTSECQGNLNCDDAYGFKDGTSMASPFVAGTLALIKSAMYDDYLKVAKELQNQPVTFHEFFHTKQSQMMSYLGLSLTPSMLAEAIMFSSTNKYNNQNPAAMVYEAQRDPLFGYGRVDVGAATKNASRVFSSFYLATE